MENWLEKITEGPQYFYAYYWVVILIGIKLNKLLGNSLEKFLFCQGDLTKEENSDSDYWSKYMTLLKLFSIVIRQWYKTL